VPSRAKKLDEYERKRDFASTPEPAPGAVDAADGDGPRRFVVQEHHARSLHWDLRLEHEGVLWSWAVPKGIPMLAKPNHLAVRTEDHPLEYLDFHGEIPRGEYGGGSMTVWDTGTYEAEKLRDDEVIVTLHGERVDGKYVLFRTRGDQWMIHRMSPPQDPTRREIPRDLQPMLATPASDVPRDDEQWSFEMKWDGMRVLIVVEGGRITLTTRQGNDATARFPELRALGEALGQTEAVLDGEVVALDERGVPSFEVLQPRMHATSPAKARRLQAERPVVCMLFDVLWLDGHPLVDLPYSERRARLEQLALTGPAWQTPPASTGNGRAALDTATALGLEGVVAKRLDSPYLVGRRSDAWRKVKVIAGQELVVGGWLDGNGRLALPAPRPGFDLQGVSVDRLTIERGFTYAYTPHIMMAWVTDVPNMNGRSVPLQFRFLVAMQGALAIGSNLYRWQQEDFALATQMVAYYKSIRETVQNGDL